MSEQQRQAAKDFLDALRWRADMVITNHFGEEVWLKQMPGYITDCCETSSPCDRHALMTK